jgi:hypothetical protein
MAKQTTSFSEVVFRGKPKVVRAFLQGLVLGSGRDVTMFFNYDEGIRHDGKAAQLAGRVGIRATECHVVVDADTSALLKRLAGRIQDETGLEICRHRRVRSAAMAFEFETFAVRYHDEIMTLLKNLPGNLRLRGFKHEVRQDSDAKGIEAYTAVHHFESMGKGEVTGPVDELVAFRHACADLPLVDVDEIALKTG